MTESAGRGPELLVLAPNWLGDVVMTAPLLSLLDSARDEAGNRPRLHLAVRRPWAALFREDPRLASLVVVERDGRHGGVAGVVRLAAELRRLRVDGVVLGPPSFRAAVVARLADIPIRVGWRGDGRSFLLNRPLPRTARGLMHHAGEFTALGDELVAACGLRGTTGVTTAVLPGTFALPAARAGEGPPIWVFAPGTTYGEAKIWPVPRAVELVEAAVRVRGVRVVLLGDAAARGFAEAMRSCSVVPWRSATPGEPGVIDLTGCTSLPEVVGWLKTARAFVGNDSGLMHLAGALGTATVGVFGSTNPAWTAPLGPLTATVTADGFACRPCYRRTCNQARFCLDEVGSERILQAVDGLLAVDPEEA